MEIRKTDLCFITLLIDIFSDNHLFSVFTGFCFSYMQSETQVHLQCKLLRIRLWFTRINQPVCQELSQHTHQVYLMTPPDPEPHCSTKIKHVNMCLLHVHRSTTVLLHQCACDASRKLLVTVCLPPPRWPTNFPVFSSPFWIPPSSTHPHQTIVSMAAYNTHRRWCSIGGVLA